MDEFSIIDAFTSSLGVPPAPRGPGDDCAVLPPSREALCLTTDAVVEGVHFRLGTFSLEDVGHKALAANLSDLAAMGARPAWALCALGLPARFTVAQTRALARGMGRLARAHGVEVLGGNVTRASELSVTLTVGGLVPRGRAALLRSGGRPGDLLYVSGPLGDAAAGLAQLEAGVRRGPLVVAQRRPAPHVRVGLVAAPFASAAIDVSDGLLQDLGHLCRASRCGAALDSAALPLSAALLSFAGPAGALELALGGGEDYVLLLAVPPRRAGAFEAALRRAHLACTRIGALTRGAVLHLDGRPAAPSGYRHFGRTVRSALRTRRG